MGLAKQAGVIVGLVSTAVGLFFLLFPQFRPERHGPTPDQSAVGVGRRREPAHDERAVPRLLRSARSSASRTQQLREVGASAFARVQIVGYRGKKLTSSARWSTRRTGDVVGQARDFAVTPTADKVTHRGGTGCRFGPAAEAT